MAADENEGVQQVFGSSSKNKDVKLSSPLRNDFTFLCNGLDSFLESLKSESHLPQGQEFLSASGACAVGSDPEDRDRPGVPPQPTNRPKTSVVSKPSNLTKVTLKDYDCPKPLSFFNQSIPVTQSHKFTRSIEFVQQCPSLSFDSLSECRFPPKLRSLYKELKPTPEPAPSTLKTRRRRQRNRLSLSDHAFDNDDAHGRRNVLPTDEDLRTTYEKIYKYRGIPYIFQCSRGKSCECPSKCAQQVDSFSLYMEINPQPGTPLHPLVRENIDCVTKESCVVDELSALVAVTTVQAPKMPLNRLFIPVSFHLKDKISCLKGIIPEIFPESKIDEPVRGVVEDLLGFVDRQLSFNIKDEYDPDTFPTPPENSLNEGSSQEIQLDVTTESPERKKRGKCKEQNKVLRELKKLMNISVTDETQEVNDTDVKCTEASCSLGCVCISVHEKYHPPPEHCGNIGCMFECFCSDKSRELYLNLGDLSKDEKSWHQTVIRKRDNALEIKSGVDRSKRRKKAPSRYENEFTGNMINRCLGWDLRADRSKSYDLKEYKAPVLPKSTKSTVILEKPKLPCVYVQKSAHKSAFNEETTKQDEVVAKRYYSEAEKVRFDKIRKALKKSHKNKTIVNNERRLRLTTTEKSSTLHDVLIWCILHNKYDCYCMNWIIFGKNNNLVSKPTCFRRFVHEKYLVSVNLEPNDAENYRQVLWYDQAKHCARTAGSLIDYAHRNKDPLFKRKSSHLLENNIVSYSNGFVKAKPVATFTSEVPSDNYPFVTSVARKITHGVGNVLKIAEALSNQIVDVGSTTSTPAMFLPPDDLKWESSDDEIVDKSDFLLDDESSEFIPKPKNRKLTPKPTQSFCFSTIMKKTQTPAKKLKSSRKSDSDSDIELVEDPIETYSLTSSSSPEPVFVDGGTLSDSSVDDDKDSSSKTVERVGNNSTNNQQESPNVPNVTNCSDVDCESCLSPTKLVIDESVGTSPSPTKSSCSSRSLRICEESPKLEKKVLKEWPNKIQNSFKTRMSSASGPKPDQVQCTLIGRRETIQIPLSVDEDDGYPQKGLFCMSLPDLGYVNVKDSRPGSFVMEDPCEPKAYKIFKSCKEGSDYMKKLVGLCINPEFACSEWVMVTRGVLEKYQSKPFDNSKLAQKNRKRQNNQKTTDKKLVGQVPKKKKIDTDVIQNGDLESRNTTRGKERRGSIGQGRQITKTFDLKIHENSSNQVGQKDIFQDSHKLLTGQESAAPEKLNAPSEKITLPISNPPPLVPVVRRNLVGTFQNINEANSFIEKNFQSRVYMRPSSAVATGSTLKTNNTQLAGTARHISGKLLRLGAPILSGPRVRGGVTPGKTVRTVLLRSTYSGQNPIIRPIVHIRPVVPGLKVSGAVVQSPTVSAIVSTTNAGVSKTQVDTTASSTYSKTTEGTQSNIKTTISDAGETSNSSKSIVIPSNPLTSPFPIRSTPKGTIVISASSYTTTAKQTVDSMTPVACSASSVAVPVNKVTESDTTDPSGSFETLSYNDSTSKLIENLAALSPDKDVESIASCSAKRAENSADSSSVADSLPAESTSDVPNPPKLPGTFVIESFSTSSSPMTTSSLAVRHCRPILPKPLIPRVPPRRADVIIPRNDDFATLISPAPSETPPSAKAPTPPDNQVFNGVLLPKSDKKDAKAYICRKNTSSKSNYRSLLQKR